MEKSIWDKKPMMLQFLYQRKIKVKKKVCKIKAKQILILPNNKVKANLFYRYTKIKKKNYQKIVEKRNEKNITCPIIIN